MTGFITISDDGHFELWQVVADLPGSIPAPREFASKADLEDYLDCQDNDEQIPTP